SQNSSASSENRNPIRLLQRSVALDPGYASALAALGHLYYYESGFGGGGEAARLRAKASLQRAVALDPGRIDAASDLINIESEEGELNRAYDDITKLLHQRPDSGAVHLVHSYVLWYAGLRTRLPTNARRLGPSMQGLRTWPRAPMSLWP